jgi:hypothetical protein
VCAFALRRLAEEGATSAVVYACGGDSYPAPKILYESLGFAQHARTVRFRTPA